MKLLKDRLLSAGPRITQSDLLEILETTGKKFKDGKWAFGKRASSKKGRKPAPEGKKKSGRGKIRQVIASGSTRQLLPPQGV